MAVQDEIKYQQILVKPKGVMRSLKVTFDDTRGEVHYWGYHRGSNWPHISGLILTVVYYIENYYEYSTFVSNKMYM